VGSTTSIDVRDQTYLPLGIYPLLGYKHSPYPLLGYGTLQAHSWNFSYFIVRRLISFIP
jgi:hypothetical protein